MTKKVLYIRTRGRTHLVMINMYHMKLGRVVNIYP